MSDEGRLARFVRSKARQAGRQFAEARRTYESAKVGAAVGLPANAAGEVRIVCRRHAERRAVGLDAEGRPACFDPDHQDCRGCAEDVRDGRVETW